MSAEAIGWVFRHSPYSGDRLVIHLALADVANDAHDNELWLTQPTIAEKSRSSVTTVGRWLKAAETDGLIEVVEAGGGRSKPKRIRLLLVIPGQRDEVLRGAKPGQSGRETRSMTSGDLLLTQENSNSRGTAADPLLGFDDFWSVYPTRRGRKIGKAKCQGRWKKLSLDERRAAWRGAVNYSREVGDFAKDPERWLRDRLWEDYDGDPAPVHLDQRPGATPFYPPSMFEHNHVYGDDAE